MVAEMMFHTANKCTGAETGGLKRTLAAVLPPGESLAALALTGPTACTSNLTDILH